MYMQVRNGFIKTRGNPVVSDDNDDVHNEMEAEDIPKEIVTISLKIESIDEFLIFKYYNIQLIYPKPKFLHYKFYVDEMH